MKKELLQKAIDHIAQDDVELGSCALFANGRPCCALGHMASLVGIGGYKETDLYTSIGDAYGMTPEEVERVYVANDGAGEDCRKQAVLDLLKDWLKSEPA